MGYRMPTTKQGKGHISSEDDGGLNSAIFGSGNYVVDVGNMFAPTIIDNNTIRLSDGEGIHNGRHFRIPENDYQDITIDNGEMGKKRIDLIVNRYEKTTSTGIESGKFTVIKGTSTTGTPEAPQVIEGNIKSGATESEMPLIEVELDGINIVAVREVFDVIMPMAKINELYTELNKKTIVCEIDRKGIGANYYYIAAKEGYVLSNVYNRNYDICNTGISYFDVQSGTYVVHLTGSLASGAIMQVREVWIKD